uniref:deubiquitinase MYSM1-like n=1 Tax=Myxine glutinosa TaxID=7769 RepID=UPI00358EFB59
MALSRTQAENTARDEDEEDEEVDVEGDLDGNGFHDVIANLTQPLVNQAREECLNNNWVGHVHDEMWTLDASIDAESRKTIEQMLKEERQYLFRKGNFGKHSQLLKQDPAGAGSSCRRKAQREKIKSNGTLKNRRVPWTQAETAAFEEGLAQFGHSWTKISNLIPSRSLLQVRVFARRYLRTRDHFWTVLCRGCSDACQG